MRRGSQTVSVRYRGGPDETHGAGAEFHGGGNLADIAARYWGDRNGECPSGDRFPRVDPRWADAKLAERWERLLEMIVRGAGCAGGAAS